MYNRSVGVRTPEHIWRSESDFVECVLLQRGLQEFISSH